MARPRTYEEDRVTTAVRLPPDLLERADEEAHRRRVSRTLIMEWALADWLEENEGVEL